MGLLLAYYLANKILGKTLAFLPKTTIIGAIANYLVSADEKGFQPMNANFGIMAPLDFPHKKKERKGLYAKRALEIMQKEIEQL